MAKFNSCNNPAEVVPSRPVRIAGQGQSSLTSKVMFERIANLENASPPARPSNLHKSPSFKPPLGIKPFPQDSSDKEPKTPPLKNNPLADRIASLAQAASREANEKVVFPKPLGPKPTEILKEESKPKPRENRLINPTLQKSDLKPPGLKASSISELQDDEAKPVLFPKVAGVKEKFRTTAQENEPKSPFLKPHLRQKPSLNPHPIQNEEISNRNVFVNQGPTGSLGPKPKFHSFRSPTDDEKKSNNEIDSAAGHSHGMALKSSSNLSNLSQAYSKRYGQQNEGIRPSIPQNNIFKVNQEDSGSTSSAVPSKFVSSSRVASTGPWASKPDKEERDKNFQGPKRKAIPPSFKLGPAPQKPNRPPTVDLGRFQKGHQDSFNTSHSTVPPPVLPLSIPVTKVTPQHPTPPPPPPPPPASHPSNQAPSLPPRNIKPRGPENEENYDDVDLASEGIGNAEESQNSDGELETYEGVDDMRPTEEEKKKEKEEKKKADQEKKEQKEKLKKEQEIRKKFKLLGPITVMHQAKACTDFRGGKNDLMFKQGDKIEIIRIADNPEGKWLGRSKGAYGYIKTTMVEIDYDSLKRKPRSSINIASRQPDSDQDVYDDIGDEDSISSHSGSQSMTGAIFPPPPACDEIYDGIDDDNDVVQTRSVSRDEDKSDSWTRGLMKIIKGKDCEKKSVRGTTTKVNVTEDNGGSPGTSSARQPVKDSGDSDVYDDVEPADFPPPPKEISQGINTKPLIFGKLKSDERDSQKSKKMEKEEKEFRKKFKYDGDIRVLYTTTITRTPSSKKRGSKDLQVKAGETVEVIKNVDDTKVLCRNEEGKYGYVPKSCIVDDDDEIYDDIADDCIYDND